jgi:FMN hydrolase / 5-amino-6-(5-phospho-D-ribitylamino)uracil phosphatase
MTSIDTPLAVSFDFGQTLSDLDMDMLSRRLAERAVAVEAAALARSEGAAWAAYNEAVLRGIGGHPWRILMRRLLSEAAAPEASIEALVEWLWSEQPHKNLWRRPVPGMIELVADLNRAGIAVAIISNSEGRLAEFAQELGWARHFAVLADSGKLGIEKPDRGIFEWTSERLGIPLNRIVHVGDSYAADVEGALKAGMRALWFRGDPGRSVDPRVKVCRDAAEARAALAAWGLTALI